MYPILLSVHNILRWIVILTAAWALVNAYTGWLQRRAWTENDRRAGLFFTIAMDLQVLIGLLLYFVFSPLTTNALGDLGAAMGDDTLRFFAVEHIVTMLVAVALVHIGSVRARRGADATARFRNAAIWYTLAIVAVLAGIPWVQSPLWRF